MRELTYYVGATLDGYIAGPNGEYDRLPIEPDLVEFINEVRPETVPTAAREAVGLAGAPNRLYDTVIMGRGTYLPGLETGYPSPYAHLEQYVFSATLDPALAPDVTFVAGDAVATVRELKRREGKGIWLCGGGKLAASLVDEIDEIVLKRYPLVLGGGLPLFDGPYAPLRFDLVENRTFDSGMTVQTYRKR
ncbi:dihydrofolate reductase family protein [Glycomyces terrestris]|uniref:Dihydrofolate reductase n=1 Tax=Glycomyces terrestris TaxID=2493553 RepID=A0A426UUJ8_9ACTN|nr:dihydrofolate reductase family protein [Glycomyces terrestris]RRR97601.1 dihydrofolate reductase [Glycomyces terrestris]